MSQEDRGPRSNLARYAYGWSDKKPWRDVLVLVVLVIVAIVVISVVPLDYDH